MNRIFLLGRLTSNVELRTFGDKKVANFSIAVQRSNDREKADFINCSAWNKTAEVLEKYTAKGSQILVEGELNVDKGKDDKYYTKVNVQKVTLLGSNSNTQENTQEKEQEETYVTPKVEEPKFEDFDKNTFDVTEEDLPF